MIWIETDFTKQEMKSENILMTLLFSNLWESIFLEAVGQKQNYFQVVWKHHTTYIFFLYIQLNYYVYAFKVKFQ